MGLPMLFDEEALQNKMEHLDSVLDLPLRVEEVVGRHVAPPFRLTHVPRIWEPGGGATLFRIHTDADSYLLKVKHRSVWVESRLESEKGYLRKPSLTNESQFLQTLRGCLWVPRVLFFDAEGPLEFLAMEWLEPLETAAPKRTAGELLDAWHELRAAVRELFDRGIVHTDLHERNLCFRGDQIVIVDFEEARFFGQDVPFEQSLDVVGENRYGDLGEVPEADGLAPALTCLTRLEAVFRRLIRNRVPELISRCHFDRGCPYNRDPLQQPDPRIYQSLQLGALTVSGQRPLRDRRLDVLARLVRSLTRGIGPIVHLDIGSNLGVFCLRSGELRNVHRAIGVDASEEFVRTARVLAFLRNQEKVEFHRVFCGEELLSPVVDRADLITMFSVYHHIPNKDRFLEELPRLNPLCLVMEMATQDRFYPERGSFTVELSYIRNALGFAHCRIVASSADYGRPIVVLSHVPLSASTVLCCRLAASDWARWIRHLGARSRSAIRRLRTTLRERLRGDASKRP